MQEIFEATKQLERIREETKKLRARVKAVEEEKKTTQPDKQTGDWSELGRALEEWMMQKNKQSEMMALMVQQLRETIKRRIEQCKLDTESLANTQTENSARVMARIQSRDVEIAQTREQARTLTNNANLQAKEWEQDIARVLESRSSAIAGAVREIASRQQMLEVKATNLRHKSREFGPAFLKLTPKEHDKSLSVTELLVVSATGSLPKGGRDRVVVLPPTEEEPVRKIKAEFLSEFSLLQATCIKVIGSFKRKNRWLLSAHELLMKGTIDQLEAFFKKSFEEVEMDLMEQAARMRKLSQHVVSWRIQIVRSRPGTCEAQTLLGKHRQLLHEIRSSEMNARMEFRKEVDNFLARHKKRMEERQNASASFEKEYEQQLREKEEEDSIWRSSIEKDLDSFQSFINNWKKDARSFREEEKKRRVSIDSRRGIARTKDDEFRRWVEATEKFYADRLKSDMQAVETRKLFPSDVAALAQLTSENLKSLQDSVSKLDEFGKTLAAMKLLSDKTMEDESNQLAQIVEKQNALEKRVADEQAEWTVKREELQRKRKEILDSLSLSVDSEVVKWKNTLCEEKNQIESVLKQESLERRTIANEEIRAMKRAFGVEKDEVRSAREKFLSEEEALIRSSTMKRKDWLVSWSVLLTILFLAIFFSLLMYFAFDVYFPISAMRTGAFGKAVSINTPADF